MFFSHKQYTKNANIKKKIMLFHPLSKENVYKWCFKQKIPTLYYFKTIQDTLQFSMMCEGTHYL